MMFASSMAAKAGHVYGLCDSMSTEAGDVTATFLFTGFVFSTTNIASQALAAPQQRDIFEIEPGNCLPIDCKGANDGSTGTRKLIIGSQLGYMNESAFLPQA